MPPIPGLPYAHKVHLEIVYASSDQDVNVYTDLGSPTGKQLVLVRIDSGVTLSSSDAAIPAMTFEGFSDDSAVILWNEGEVRGAGGLGGTNALRVQNSIGYWSGAGGGGAGTVVGPGGATEFPGAIRGLGSDGTASAGGSAGTNGDTGGSYGGQRGNTDGEAGGTAVYSGDVDLTIFNASGSIFGGGGGGGAGGLRQAAGSPGGDGGGLGEAGDDGIMPGSGGSVVFVQTSGGAGGYAVKRTASGSITFVDGGSSPNVEGTVGE